MEVGKILITTAMSHCQWPFKLYAYIKSFQTGAPSDVGDIVMLATLSCQQFFNLGDRIDFNILYLSPTHFVFNIRRQYLRSRIIWFSILEFPSLGKIIELWESLSNVKVRGRDGHENRTSNISKLMLY